MIEPLRSLFVLPAVRRWLATSDLSWRSLPIPTQPVVVSTPGPDPDRVLLAGSGIAVGYGMTSHDRALGGQLARELSALTERGTRVEITTTEDMTLDELRTTLGACNLRALDAIIATPGGMESLFCLPARTLRKQVETLLDHIATNAPASLHVFLVAVPPLSRIVRMPRVLGFLADQSARVLNRELAAACLVRANATFIPFDAPGELAGRNGSGRTYHRWARVIAPIVTTVLESQARTARG